MEDLWPGGPLYQRDNILAEDILPWYKQLPAFKNVVISQFKACLKDHWLVAAKDLHQALQEEQYLVQDRQLYPRQPCNERGKPNFGMHNPAKLMLREKTSRTSTLDNSQNSKTITKFETGVPFTNFWTLLKHLQVMCASFERTSNEINPLPGAQLRLLCT
jgi:hypothetical protein